MVCGGGKGVGYILLLTHTAVKEYSGNSVVWSLSS